MADKISFIKAVNVDLEFKLNDRVNKTLPFKDDNNIDFDYSSYTGASMQVKINSFDSSSVWTLGSNTGSTNYIDITINGKIGFAIDKVNNSNNDLEPMAYYYDLQLEDDQNRYTTAMYGRLIIQTDIAI